MSDNKKPALTHYYDLEVEINLDKDFVIVDCANGKYFPFTTTLKDYLMGPGGKKAGMTKMPEGKEYDELIIVERTEYNLYSSTPAKERELKDIKAPDKLEPSKAITPIKSSTGDIPIPRYYTIEKELNSRQVVISSRFSILFPNAVYYNPSSMNKLSLPPEMYYTFILVSEEDYIDVSTRMASNIKAKLLRFHSHLGWEDFLGLSQSSMVDKEFMGFFDNPKLMWDNEHILVPRDDYDKVVRVVKEITSWF